MNLNSKMLGQYIRDQVKDRDEKITILEQIERVSTSILRGK